MPAVDSSHTPSALTSFSLQAQIEHLLPWLTKRRGSTGGGRSGGSSSSSGSSSSGSSSGTKGSSPPPYSAGSPPAYSVYGGSAISGLGSKSSTSASLGASQRGSLYGSAAGGSASYGRSPYGLYGFWPLGAYGAYGLYGRAPANRTRPGGDLLAAAVVAPDSADTTYVLYGDTQSVNALLPALAANCQAANGTAPADLAANATVESYRDDSLELLRFPAAPVNATFEGCLNATIGDNLLIASTSAGAGAAVAPLVLACLVAMATGLHLA